MEANENDYDTGNEAPEPLQEPHPEPSGDKFSEQYDEESSHYSNSRTNSRAADRVINDESFDAEVMRRSVAYNDYLDE